MSTPHPIAASHRLRHAFVGLAGFGLVLVAGPARGADGPTASPSADAPSSTETTQTKETKKTKASKPRPTAKRGLDDTARRALRASSSRAAEPERVAMRTVAPAPADGGDPPSAGKSKGKAKRTASKDADDARAPSDESGRKISLDEDFLVEGKLEKPNAFYILRRSQSGYDWARLDAKFLPLVLESVQDPLF